MRIAVVLALLSVIQPLPGQTSAIEELPVRHFHVAAESRLAALARLGAQMRLSILVESGEMEFLQRPVSVASDGATVLEVIRMIVKGPTPYTVKTEKALVVVADPDGSDRVPTMALGPISWSQKSLFSTYFFLAERVREAMGCPVQGYAYAGPSIFDLVIPAIELPSATFEQVVSRVADAAEPSMWIVKHDPSATGCGVEPFTQWEIGLYSFGSSFSDCDASFKESLGTDFVVFQRSSHGESIRCVEPRMPESMPQAMPVFPRHFH